MLPLLFGLSCGTTAAGLHGELEGSLPAAPVPGPGLVEALQVEMTWLKKTLQRENSELRLENKEIKKELAEIKNNSGQDLVIQETLNMINSMNATMHEMDARLSLAGERTAVCGYNQNLFISNTSRLNFDRVYEEVDSTGGHLDAATGKFTAGRSGIYYISVETAINLDDGEWVFGDLKTTSGMVQS